MPPISVLYASIGLAVFSAVNIAVGLGLFIRSRKSAAPASNVEAPPVVQAPAPTPAPAPAPARGAQIPNDPPPAYEDLIPRPTRWERVRRFCRTFGRQQQEQQEQDRR